jgi:hypothetical protein
MGVAAGCASSRPPPEVPSPPSALAPSTAPVDFAFDSLDGRAVTAAATRGALTVIAFVTTSSIPAQAQVDFLVAMAKNDGERVHYAVVALEPVEDRELVEMYAKALAIPFPVAIADSNTRSGAGPFGDVTHVPVTIVLDSEGRVAWRTDGRVAKSDELRAAMRRAAP